MKVHRSGRRQVLLLLAIWLVAACTAGPRALIPGEDACAYCRMTIDDLRFGALVVSDKGRLETFDSIECAASYVAALPEGTPPRGIWVADFTAPSRWLDARTAQFLHQSRLRSPMGRDLAAFAPATDAAALVREHGGKVIGWREVRQLAATVTPGAR